MATPRPGRTVPALALIAALLAVCGPACADLIGVNFVGQSALSVSAMDPSETAGVIAQANWNNASHGTGTLSALVDATGAATGAGVQWRSSGQYLAIDNTPGNNRLMRGHVTRLLADPLRVTVSGLDSVRPGGLYDVLVYFDAWNSGADWVTTYTIGTRVLVGTDRAGTNFDGAFVEDTGSGGNYVRFRDVTGDAFTLAAEIMPGSGGSVAVNALQIVFTPEPATVALLAVGLAAGLFLRRRG